ncbi:class I SAM-dependent methyltransferase [Palleronia rufa]|uniref:class I SAM-dependent methyltransferase n=1 Tax=Palleronia rufa TaxID=1530186 RepID=UPI0006907103|nr:class I SAM-dependent methyltransferase [Palleronia rufa]
MKTIDRATLEWYETNADLYADRVSRSSPDEDLMAFIDALPATEDPVLDWGCGPGNTAAILASFSIAVAATDISPAMARLASSLGIDVRIEAFDDLPRIPLYRGIWANFSLIHAPRAALPGLIARAAEALVAGGVLHLGLDISVDGTGPVQNPEFRLASGRLVGLVGRDEADRMVRMAGLSPIRLREGDVTSPDGHSVRFLIHQSRKPRHPGRTGGKRPRIC